MSSELKRKQTEFDHIWSRICEIGAEAYREHGYNLVAILADEKTCNGRSVVSKVYEGPGATGFLSIHGPVERNELADKLKCYIPRHLEESEARGGGLHRRVTLGRKLETDSSDYTSSTEEDDWTVCARERETESVNQSPAPVYQIKQMMIEKARQVGLRMKEGFLPWSTLPSLCSEAGVYIDNYPHGVRPPTCGVSIHRLSLCEIKAFSNALKSGDILSLRFVKVSDECAASIKESRHPVIIYAPPPPNNIRDKSKRIFLDGTIDYEGHPKRKIRNEDCASGPLLRFKPNPSSKIPAVSVEIEDSEGVSTSDHKEKSMAGTGNRPCIKKQWNFVDGSSPGSSPGSSRDRNRVVLKRRIGQKHEASPRQGKKRRLHLVESTDSDSASPSNSRAPSEEIPWATETARIPNTSSTLQNGFETAVGDAFRSYVRKVLSTR